MGLKARGPRRIGKTIEPGLGGCYAKLPEIQHRHRHFHFFDHDLYHLVRHVALMNAYQILKEILQILLTETIIVYHALKSI